MNSSISIKFLSKIQKCLKWEVLKNWSKSAFLVYFMVNFRNIEFFKILVTFLYFTLFGWNLVEINGILRGAFSQSFSPKEWISPIQIFKKFGTSKKNDPVRERYIQHRYMHAKLNGGSDSEIIKNSDMISRYVYKLILRKMEDCISNKL